MSCQTFIGKAILKKDSRFFIEYENKRYLISRRSKQLLSKLNVGDDILFTLPCDRKICPYKKNCIHLDIDSVVLTCHICGFTANRIYPSITKWRDGILLRDKDCQFIEDILTKQEYIIASMCERLIENYYMKNNVSKVLFEICHNNHAALKCPICH
jgi:hypothetical protein